MVSDTRLTSLYTMRQGDTAIFSGILTVEFLPEGTGCQLRLTEQGVFYDGHDLPGNHKLGYQAMLAALRRFLPPDAA